MGGPKRGIDAHEFLELLCKSAPDSMLLLDCWLHTRITAKWKRESSNTEIILRGQEMQDHYGQKTHGEIDFTDALVSNRQRYVETLSSGEHKGAKALRSIPQIMASDREMHTNPQRIWLDRTWAGDEKVVYRFKVDPEKIRDTGQLEFFAHLIQGRTQEGDSKQKFSDEGLGDMDETATGGEAENEDENDGSDHGQMFVDP